VQEVIDSPPAGLRERKKAERRLALIDAAHRLVEERGFDCVTVEDIAAAAGVSTRTFFNYFDTKDDAIVPAITWPSGDTSTAQFVEGGPTGDLASDLDLLLRRALESWQTHAERSATAARLAAQYPQLVARRAAGIERYRVEVAALFAARAGRTRPEPEDTIGALAFVHLLRGAIACWESDPDGAPPAEHLSSVRARLRALAAEPAP